MIFIGSTYFITYDINRIVYTYLGRKVPGTRHHTWYDMEAGYLVPGIIVVVLPRSTIISRSLDTFLGIIIILARTSYLR